MRLALLCAPYTPRHAAPREPLAPSSRQALAVGLAAALLPLGAAPALADDDAPATTGGTTAVAAAVDTPAPAAAPAVAPVRQTTTLSLSAPSAAPTTRVRVGVRLLADGHAVRNGYVRLEKSTGSGWTFAGRLLTDGTGLGRGTLRVAGSTRLRAAYTGTATRTPAVSAVRSIRSSSLRAATTAGAAVVREAARHVGAPYVYGATGPSAFDCSGFTRYVYGRLGVSLPHNSGAQARVTRPVSKAAARAGDLVVMSGHVGIYAGSGRMYDAPHSGSRVTLRPIYTSSYSIHRVL